MAWIQVNTQQPGLVEVESGQPCKLKARHMSRDLWFVTCEG